MVKHIFKNIFILIAAKNYTSNFADSPFGPDFFLVGGSKNSIFFISKCFSVLIGAFFVLGGVVEFFWKFFMSIFYLFE